MQYLLYSLLFALLYIYLGIGLTLLTCPNSLKKYALFLSPMVGYSYLTLFGWYCYSLNVGGTDVYALTILLPPAIFLYFAYKSGKYEKLLDSKSIAPLIIGIIIFLIISIPLLTKIDMLTSISIGNNDIADSASISTFLKEFTRSDTVGFLGQSGFFKWQADQAIFGGSLSTAFAGSLFSLETYQLQSMSIHIFFFFSIPLFFALAQESFGYNYYAATGIMVLYGLSPIMYYTIYNGFQGQIIATGLALCILLLNLQVINNSKKFSDYFSYIPLAVLFNWGISLTYPHMLPFIYIPLICYQLILVLHSKSFSNIFYWISFVILTLIVVVILSPFRAKALVSYLFQMANVQAGWYMPLFSPDAIFGIMVSNMAALRPHSGFIRIILSIPLLLIMALGFLNAYRTDRKLFLFSGVSLVVVIVGYTILSFTGKTEVGWGGYKSYKLISFFLPLILLSSLSLFRNMNFTGKYRINYLLPFSLVILILCNVYSISKVTKQVVKRNRMVDSDMADLRKIESNNLVKSINILGTDPWDILWEVNFLMRKKLYFETSTYGGRTASNLDGEWNLIRCFPAISGKSITLSEEIIPVNSSYMLIRNNSYASNMFKAEISTLVRGGFKCGRYPS